MYVLLVNLLGFAAGAASFAAFWVTLRRPPYWWGYALVKLGILITSGILLYKVIPVAVVQVDVWTWAYIGGLLITSVGLVGVTIDLINRSVRQRFANELETSIKKVLEETKE
jgi:hypothetical protein